MDVKVDADGMREMVAKAIFDSMTPEKRDEILSKSIQTLLATPSGSSYEKRSELQRIFDQEVQITAKAIAHTKMESDPAFRAKVEAVFADAVKRVFDDMDTREKIISALGDAIRKAITGDRY